MCNVYHYTKESSLEKIVKTRNFHISSSLAVNDPTDRCYGACFFAEYLKSDSSLAKMIRNGLSCEEIDHACFKGISQPYYTISFGIDPYNAILWDRYADQGNGVVIEIDTDQLQKETNRLIITSPREGFCDIGFPIFKEVQYGNCIDFIEEEARLILRNNGILNDMDEWLENNPFPNDLIVSYLSYCFSGIIKKASWGNEKEVRLLYKDETYFFKNKKEVSHSIFKKNEKKEMNAYLREWGLNPPKRNKSYLEWKYRLFNPKAFVKRFYAKGETYERVKTFLEKNQLSGFEVINLA